MNAIRSALRCAVRRPKLIVALFCLRGVFAVGAALLWLGAFVPTWLMGLPLKDASLFQPGLSLPLRLFAEHRQPWLERAQRSLWFGLTFIVVAAVVTGFVLHALNRALSDGERSWVWPSLKSLALQLVTVGASWVLVFSAGYLAMQLARILPALVYQLFGEKGADATLVALAVSLLFVIAFIRIGCDLMRAGLSRVDVPLASALSTAVDVLRAQWRFYIGAYACFMLPTPGLALLLEAWYPTFGGPVQLSPGRALLHQGLVLTSCVLQLAWWVLALTHVPVPHQPTERQAAEASRASDLDSEHLAI